MIDGERECSLLGRRDRGGGLKIAAASATLPLRSFKPAKRIQDFVLGRRGASLPG